MTSMYVSADDQSQYYIFDYYKFKLGGNQSHVIDSDVIL